MRSFLQSFPSSLLLCCLTPAITCAQQDKLQLDQAQGPAYTKSVRPLLKTYCFECHNTTKRRAGLDLEKIDNNAAALDSFELWDQVGERLRSKEMPPPKAKQPADSEREALLAWVKHVAES